MIELSNVTHAFGERTVLRDVSVRLGERRIGIIGANGSGKTTFARLLNGLVLPDTGSVTVRGHSTRSAPKKVREIVGFLFQDPDNQIVMPLVEEDIAFSLRPYRLSRQERDQRVTEILDQYGLGGLRDLPAHRLSGGQKQLLALSAVMVRKPSVMVLDEPTTLLDLKNRKLVERAVTGLDAQVICISHDLEFLSGFDRVIVFDEGRIVSDGEPAAAIDAYVGMQAC